MELVIRCKRVKVVVVLRTLRMLVLVPLQEQSTLVRFGMINSWECNCFLNEANWRKRQVMCVSLLVAKMMMGA